MTSANHLLTSAMLQGLVISLPYCYLNTEVQSVVRNHYRRWQLIRTVGTGHMSGDKYFYRVLKYFYSLRIILQTAAASRPARPTPR